MTSGSKTAYEWAGVAGEVLAILLGAGMIAWGWTSFGQTLMVIGVIGLVVSLMRLWRMARRPADG